MAWVASCIQAQLVPGSAHAQSEDGLVSTAEKECKHERMGLSGVEWRYGRFRDPCQGPFLCYDAAPVSSLVQRTVEPDLPKLDAVGR